MPSNTTLSMDKTKTLQAGLSEGEQQTLEMMKDVSADRMTVDAFHSSLITIYVLGFLQILPSSLSVIASIALVENVVSGVDYPTSESVFVIASAFAINSATRVLVSKTFGSLSDYLGRKPLCVWSCFIWIVSRSFLVSATSESAIYISAFFYGLDVYGPVGQAWIGDLVHDEERGKAYGLLAGLSFGVGFVIGLPVGGIITQTKGPKMSLYVGLAMQAVVMFAVAVVPISDTLGVKSLTVGDADDIARNASESMSVGGDTDRGDDARIKNGPEASVIGGKRGLPPDMGAFLYDNSLVPVLNLWDENNIICLASENPWDFFCYFWAQASQQSLQNTFLLFVQAAYRFDDTQAGISLAFVAITVGVFSPVQLNFFQERGVVFWAMVIQLLASIFFCISGLPEKELGGLHVCVALGIVGMFGISFGGTWIPAYPSVITKQYDVTKKGEVLGTLTLIAELANVAAYPVGILLSYTLSNKAPMRWPGAVWLLSGSFLLVAIVTHYVTMGSKASRLVWMGARNRMEGAGVDGNATAGDESRIKSVERNPMVHQDSVGMIQL